MTELEPVLFEMGLLLAIHFAFVAAVVETLDGLGIASP